MESKALAWLIDKGTPALIFVLIIMSTVQSAVLKHLEAQIKEMSNGMIWKDQYNSDHKDLEDRIKRLEDKENGKKK